MFTRPTSNRPISNGPSSRGWLRCGTIALRLLVAVTLLRVTGAPAQTAPKTAHANIMNAMGKNIGTATITAAKMGVRIRVDVSGLTPGMHGIHIHAVGMCQGPMFTTAGGHLNPNMKMHGKDNPMGPHAGDLLNITANAKGAAKATLTDTMVTLGNGPNGLFHQGGTALVIHAMPDDYKTDPTGNSGDRVACGVITQ